MIHGYARVSTSAQELATHLDQLKKLLATAALGDTVIIPAIDRLR